MSKTKYEGLERAIILKSEDSFGGKPEIIYGSGSDTKKKKKLKKQSYKPLEKKMFKLAGNFDKATAKYKERHSRSNKKKKDGWIRDFSKNIAKAASKLR